MTVANPASFFDALRGTLFTPSLTQSEVNGCNVILDAMAGEPLGWTAYALATAFHETAGTMQPIQEYGGNAYYTRLYDVTGAYPQRAIQNGNTEPGDGIKYCGKGFVQLTWKNNYARAGREIGVDLIDHPELAMAPNIAAQVLRRGMTEGWFTARKFNDYLPASGPAALGQFVMARRIINGLDRANLVADHAEHFQSALQAGGWE
jgi:predicted chitinase